MDWAFPHICLYHRALVPGNSNAVAVPGLNHPIDLHLRHFSHVFARRILSSRQADAKYEKHIAFDYAFAVHPRPRNKKEFRRPVVQVLSVAGASH